MKASRLNVPGSGGGKGEGREAAVTVEEERAEGAEEVMEAAMAEEEMTEAAMVYGMKFWASDARGRLWFAEPTSRSRCALL